MRTRIQQAAAAGIGLAVLTALTACGGAGGVTLTGGTDPQGSTTAASASASAPASDAATGTPSEVATPSTAGHGSLASAAWARVLQPPECTYAAHGERVELAGVSYGDLTGDGNQEAFVVASCLSTTSTQPQTLYVFDGASSPTKPKLLARVPSPRNLIWRDLQVSVDGRIVHLQAQALSPDAPMCCPDRSYAQILNWNGHGFDAMPPVVRVLSN